MPNERIDFGGLSEADWLAGVDLGMAPPAYGRRQEEDDRWEITKGVSAGVDQLQGIGGGLMAFAGDVIGSESLQETGIDIYQEQMDEAAESEARIASYEDIKGVDDAFDFFMHGFGTLLPMFVPSLVSGGVGSFMGKRAMQKGLRSYMKKLAKDGMDKGMRKEAASKWAGQKVALGTFTGAYLSSGAMETGSIYGDIAEQTGEREAGVSLIGGAVAGFLDAYPAYRILRSHGLAGKVVKKADKFFLSEAGKQMLAEGGTEAAQTVIERFAVQTVDENIDTLSDEGIEEIINAGLIGAFGGGVLGGVGHPLRRRRSEREIKDEVDGEGGDALDAETRIATENSQEDEQDLQRERQTGEEVGDFLDRVLGGTEGRYDLGLYPDDDPVTRWRQNLARRRQGGPTGPLAEKGDLPEEVVEGEIPEEAGPQDIWNRRQAERREALRAEREEPAPGREGLTEEVGQIDEVMAPTVPGVTDAGGLEAGGAPGPTTIQQRQGTFAEAREARRQAEAGNVPGVTVAGEMEETLDEMQETPSPAVTEWEQTVADRRAGAAARVQEKEEGEARYQRAVAPVEPVDALMKDPTYAQGAAMPEVEMNKDETQFRMVVKDSKGDVVHEVFPWRDGDKAIADDADNDFMSAYRSKRAQVDEVRKSEPFSPYTDQAIKQVRAETRPSSSRDTIVYMTPDEFLEMAEEVKTPDQEKVDHINQVWTDEGAFDSVPFLDFALNDDGTATVVGHEGRHRAMKLKEQGHTTMAVKLTARDSTNGTIRWGRQDEIPAERWPRILKGQERDTEMPFPEGRVFPTAHRPETQETAPDPLAGLDLKKVMLTRRSKKDGQPGKARASAEVLLRHHQKRADNVQGLLDCLLKGNK